MINGLLEQHTLDEVTGDNLQVGMILVVNEVVRHVGAPPRLEVNPSATKSANVDLVGEQRTSASAEIQPVISMANRWK